MSTNMKADRIVYERIKAADKADQDAQRQKAEAAAEERRQTLAARRQLRGEIDQAARQLVEVLDQTGWQHPKVGMIYNDHRYFVWFWGLLERLHEPIGQAAISCSRYLTVDSRGTVAVSVKHKRRYGSYVLCQLSSIGLDEKVPLQEWRNYSQTSISESILRGYLDDIIRMRQEVEATQAP